MSKTERRTRKIRFVDLPVGEKFLYYHSTLSCFLKYEKTANIPSPRNSFFFNCVLGGSKTPAVFSREETIVHQFVDSLTMSFEPDE